MRPCIPEVRGCLSLGGSWGPLDDLVLRLDLVLIFKIYEGVSEWSTELGHRMRITICA